MIKLVVEINRHESRIIEETLFELAPHNWTIHFNRRNKSHRIEGVFRSESLASKAANELNNFLDFKNDLNFKFEELCPTDWKNSYKHHFKVWNLTNYFFIPAWEKELFKVPPQSTSIFIDPGMAFGTGTHETTRLCLELMHEAFTFQKLLDFNLVDIGCGSGILSIFARKLGFQKVLGIDHDQDSISNAQSNQVLNEIDSGLDFMLMDLQRLDDMKFNCVIVNIQADVLLENSHRIINLLSEESTLILSGILSFEAKDVEKHYENIMTTAGINSTIELTEKGQWSAIKINCYSRIKNQPQRKTI